MVYAEDLKSLTRKGLWVRVPPPAHKRSEWHGVLCCAQCVGDSNAGAMSRKLKRPRGGAQPESCDGTRRGAGESHPRHNY